jgi:hypothetical protein
MPIPTSLGAVLERLRLNERRDRRARRRLRDRRPKHLKPRRAKAFGQGRTNPLDRNAKARIECRMRLLKQRTGEPHKHYGALTAKAYAVGRALLYTFHNSRRRGRTLRRALSGSGRTHARRRIAGWRSVAVAA